MRRTLVIVVSLVLAAPGVRANGPAPQQGPSMPVGTLQGVAKDARGHKLAGSKVRVRNAATGAVAAEVVSDAAGTFSVAGLTPATYVVEVVSATGQVVGVSAAVTVTAAATTTVTVTATAAGTIAAAAAGGGFSVLGLGAAASAAVISAAAAAAIVAVAATRPAASPSR